jgi:putative acetyltransferase
MRLVRPEAPSDADAIRRVVERAFGQPEEADLLDRLREQLSEDDYRGFVAVKANEVVGHVAFTPVTLEPAQPDLDLVGLAPMAVLPEHQRSGIGRALVREGLDACRRDGAGAAVVLGDPAYYRLFGFRPAALFGLACTYDAPPEAFMALELAPDVLRRASGLVHYHPAFG